MTLPQAPSVRVKATRGGLRVVAGRVDQLAAQAVVSLGCEPADEIEVEVERWRAPRAGWLGALRLAGAVSVTVEPTRAGVRVRLRLHEPADPGLVLAAVVRLLRPTAAPIIADELTVAPGLPATASAVAGWIRDVVLPGEQRDRHVRRTDTLLAGAGSAGADLPVDRARTVVLEPDGWRVGDRLWPVWVDPAVHRPVGRRGTGPWAVATASVDADVVTVHPTDGSGRPIVLAGSVDAAAVSALRAVAAISTGGRQLPPRIAQQLAACGVVCDSADLPPGGDREHDLPWQARSVRVRRDALRAHGPWAALDAWPTVSVVLVTNRPEQVDHAIAQVAALDYPRLEVVLGLHGDRIDAQAVRDRTSAVPHPVRIVPVLADATLGQALQRCSDRAEGALVTKMDDDDHYGREHVWDLVLAHAYSGAQVVGKALDWVYLEREDETVYRPVYAAEKYASFVCGGTMLISRADLAAVGGWRPVPKSVDRALLDRVLADGGLVYRTHGLGYTYVRRAGDRTASVQDGHFRTRTAATYPGLLRDPALGTA